MANELQEHFAEMLLERIRSDRHPSVTQMNLLEASASPRVLIEYTLHLVDRINADRYPSVSMMQRLQRLAERWGP
jgi:hypothetical protein